jgi:hypothetical protein
VDRVALATTGMGFLPGIPFLGFEYLSRAVLEWSRLYFEHVFLLQSGYDPRNLLFGIAAVLRDLLVRGPRPSLAAFEGGLGSHVLTDRSEDGAFRTGETIPLFDCAQGMHSPFVSLQHLGNFVLDRLVRYLVYLVKGRRYHSRYDEPTLDILSSVRFCKKQNGGHFG